jgi:Enterobacter phage Enc34, ssDNA-binding protein
MAKELVLYTFKNVVRIGFSNIITARQFQDKGQGKGDPRFDATFILPPDSPDLVTLKDLVIAEAKALNPGKRLIARRLTQDELDAGCVEIAVPWKDGTRAADRAKEAGKDQEFFRGMVALKASSKYAPLLSGIEGGKVVEYTNPETRTTLDKLFYSGAYIVPHVALHSYKARDDKPGGVGLYLNAVCFIKHGPHIGGSRVNAAEVFKGYAGTVTATDPGSNADDFEE